MRLLLVLLFITTVAVAQEGRFNGFDVFDASVPSDLIKSGGVPRNGIEALSLPKTVPADAAEMLDYKSHSELISYTAKNGETRGYPLAVLRIHEVINDVVGGESIVVTYCPLCKTGMVFSAQVAGREEPLTFGVSGLLFHSDVLLFDQETESLWTQLGRRAISGEKKGTPLAWLPSEQMLVDQWAKQYPEASIVSVDTGKEINYRHYPYAEYHAGGEPVFPVPRNRTELREFDEIHGILLNGAALAVPKVLGPRQSTEVTLGGEVVTLLYDREKRQFTARDQAGDLVPSLRSYWFAWQAFYPETEIYTGN